jgi:diguanylate cyclase
MSKSFAGPAALNDVPLDSWSSDVEIAHWDVMFGAVTVRLRQTVDEWLASREEGHLSDADARLRVSALECAGALDQLHDTLSHEALRRQLLERKVADAQALLERTQNELADSRFGELAARHRALHDGLTQLPNRHFFRERLAHLTLSGQRKPTAVAVLYLDLDDFKPINDAHGHDTGDELLKIVAARLARAVRSQDLVSRVGGDEFACLLLDVPSREQLSHMACKLLDTVAAPIKLGELELTVRTSIGIATNADPRATPAVLIRSADAAMYVAKRRKCGYAFFDERAELAGPADSVVTHSPLLVAPVVGRIEAAPR